MTGLQHVHKPVVAGTIGVHQHDLSNGVRPERMRMRVHIRVFVVHGDFDFAPFLGEFTLEIGQPAGLVLHGFGEDDAIQHILVDKRLTGLRAMRRDNGMRPMMRPCRIERGRDTDYLPILVIGNIDEGFTEVVGGGRN